MATSSKTNFSGSVTSGHTWEVKAGIKINISSIISSQKLKYNLTWLYLDHGLVLVLQPLVHKAVLLHRQKGQGALELTALALVRPAQEFWQQVGGEPGKLRVHDTIGEPCIWSQHMQFQRPVEKAI